MLGIEYEYLSATGNCDQAQKFIEQKIAVHAMCFCVILWGYTSHDADRISESIDSGSGSASQVIIFAIPDHTVCKQIHRAFQKPIRCGEQFTCTMLYNMSEVWDCCVRGPPHVVASTFTMMAGRNLSSDDAKQAFYP